MLWYRWTVMSRRAYAASMAFQDTQQFNGFLRDLWNPKSEWSPIKFTLFLIQCSIALHLCLLSTLNFEICRYEGPRTAESLAEFVNNEGGNFSKIPFRNMLTIRKLVHQQV